MEHDAPRDNPHSGERNQYCHWSSPLSVSHFQQGVGMACLGCAPAHEILTAERLKERGVFSHGGFEDLLVESDHLFARTVFTDSKRVAPLRPASHVDLAIVRALTHIPDVANLGDHSFSYTKAVELVLLGDVVDELDRQDDDRNKGEEQQADEADDGPADEAKELVDEAHNGS
jgi:hypothetical protein